MKIIFFWQQKHIVCGGDHAATKLALPISVAVPLSSHSVSVVGAREHKQKELLSDLPS